MQIQSFADVLICDQAWEIQACSASLRSRHIDEQKASSKQLIGQSLAECFGRQFAHDARGWGQSLTVSRRPSKTFAYRYEDQIFDVTCVGGGQGFCLLLEPSARGPALAADALVRRLLHRARGLANRQQALDSAMKALRLALRADSVSVLHASPGQPAVWIAQDTKPNLPLVAGQISPLVQKDLLQDVGIVSDVADKGSWLFGDVEAVGQFLPTCVRQSSSELLAFVIERGFASAHWYVGTSADGARCCLLVEHQAAGAAGSAKRHATELAFEVLLLMLDAEHPVTT